MSHCAPRTERLISTICLDGVVEGENVVEMSRSRLLLKTGLVAVCGKWQYGVVVEMSLSS